jgi:hypothetical protein
MVGEIVRPFATTVDPTRMIKQVYFFVRFSAKCQEYKQTPPLTVASSSLIAIETLVPRDVK